MTDGEAHPDETDGKAHPDETDGEAHPDDAETHPDDAETPPGRTPRRTRRLLDTALDGFRTGRFER